ncbi:MAG: DnaJ domain-containing protein [Rhodospirillaceae bacterium]|jgi:DnaJ-class molecular chaperone|nr:DnaJ domain-containing protein [Rhodospirillaceae bacterium]
MKDLYSILGLTSRASEDDIKKAYRSLARERHPDRDHDNPWAEEDFKQLAQAYDILSDPKTRAQYDRGDIDAGGTRQNSRRSHSTASRSSASPRGGTHWGSRASTRNKALKVNGADVEYDLKVSFMDAARGCVKHVSMTNGKRLKVNIPPATADGALLRLRGQGMPGIGGGSDGDAHVAIEVMSDPTFRREETDIHVDLPVTLPEAVLGARVDAPTIDGPVSVTVPAGSNTGTILRLKGKGLANSKNGNARGDEYITLKIVLPRGNNHELKTFVEKWAPDNFYSVRPKNRS